ncbi:MarR family transcriptional regulator [Microbacterium sp. CH12i]|uniref:MarR family winged helix-turn-helix transcriptional regulator n=1 Tax=Microbacterium sp. CH12i TaxID=1479651 RepID=UPI0004616187|nr:MarR family transcriptional regulator [Microbacterium sp. CH12i]KDA06857.1 MarR family transcriptional regulator [Microbacterium sp. CH12i]
MSVPPIQRLSHTGHLIRRAQQLHVALWNQEVSSEVGSVQYAALAVLESAPGANQRELGSALDLDRSTITALVERLKRKGLIDRVQSEQDRRHKVLTITEAGRDVLRELDPKVAQMNESLTSALSDEEQVVLRRLLGTMLETGD